MWSSYFIESDLDRAINHAIDRLFTNAFEHTWVYQTPMNYRVSQNDKGVEIQVDLPGYAPDEVEVEVLDRILTVTAKPKEGRNAQEVKCSFKFKKDADADIEAEMKNGLLTIFIPKPAKAQGKKVTVKG